MTTLAVSAGLVAAIAALLAILIFAISLFTVFLMYWAVLVLIGTFFRGPGFNFIFPWNNGLFVEL